MTEQTLKPTLTTRAKIDHEHHQRLMDKYNLTQEEVLFLFNPMLRKLKIAEAVIEEFSGNKYAYYKPEHIFTVVKALAIEEQTYILSLAIDTHAGDLIEAQHEFFKNIKNILPTPNIEEDNDAQ